MIQSQELRIGNWVYSPDGYPMQIDAIDNQSDTVSLITSETGSLKYEISAIKKIELSPKLLIKIGFESKVFSDKKSIVYSHKNSPILFIDTGFNGHFSLFMYFIGGIATENISYLHDLQNIIFALTKKELEIDLNK